MLARQGKKQAQKELKFHLVLLGGWILAVRAAPYVLEAMKGNK